MLENQMLNLKASKKKGKMMDSIKSGNSSLELQEDGESHGLSPGAWGL